MKRFRFVFLLLSLFFAFGNLRAESSIDILDKAVKNIKSASGISSSFKITSPNGNVTGTFKSDGKKFKLETPLGTTWYDGTSMWTANNRSKQITLVTPTADEISEVNPFAYLNSYKSKYKTGISKRKDDNRHLVLLNPKNSKDNIKAVEVAINKKTYLPERFIIRDKNDNVTTVYVNSLSVKASNPASTFVCPVNSYPGYEVVDLR